MNLLNILLASSLTSLVVIAILEINNVTRQFIIFLCLLIFGLVVSLLLPNKNNDINPMVQIENQLKSLNSKVYENQNNVLADNVPITNTSVNYVNNNDVNYVNNIPITNTAVNYVNNAELNNIKKMLETDDKIYQQWKQHDINKINNFKELHNPPIPNNKSDDCVANLSCVIQECK
jgi:hypothetical protein